MVGRDVEHRGGLHRRRPCNGQLEAGQLQRPETRHFLRGGAGFAFRLHRRREEDGGVLVRGGHIGGSQSLLGLGECGGNAGGGAFGGGFCRGGFLFRDGRRIAVCAACRRIFLDIVCNAGRSPG